MIIGVGTDILDMRRLSPESLKPGDPFLRRAFTPREQEQAAARVQPQVYYALRFAGKEAVFKSLRTTPEGADLGEIEILDDENGAPCCTLHGELRRRAERAGGRRVHVSLSWDGTLALAFAVLEADERN